MSSQLIAVSDATFEQTVLSAPVPVIVDFWAEWCAPCTLVHGWMRRIAEHYADRLLVTTLNVDENPETLAQYAIQGIPTLLFFWQGKLQHRQVDALTEHAFQVLVEQQVQATAHNVPPG